MFKSIKEEFLLMPYSARFSVIFFLALYITMLIEDPKLAIYVGIVFGVIFGGIRLVNYVIFERHEIKKKSDKPGPKFY